MRALLGILGEPKTFFLVKTLKLKDASMVSTPGEDPKKEREQESVNCWRVTRSLQTGSLQHVQTAWRQDRPDITVHVDGNAQQWEHGSI